MLWTKNCYKNTSLKVVVWSFFKHFALKQFVSENYGRYILTEDWGVYCEGNASVGS